jgi:MFS family permease
LVELWSNRKGKSGLLKKDMLQKILNQILVRRHFWRYASFSEISELYASRLLRMLALNIAASFMSIYLYQKGFSIPSIALFWGIFYLFKVCVAIPMAGIAARIGAKHAILVSNIMYIPAMVAFALFPIYGIWALIPVVILQGASSTLYSISYSIDFSKVKNAQHAGKEIAYMNIVEKVTTGLSPLIGGLLAFFVGPQIVLVIAALLFALAAVPLMRTGEQERPHQKLNFRGFPWHLIRPNIPAQLAIGVDVFTSGTVWTLYVAVFILGVASTNDVYAKNGALLSVVLFAALAASYTYGRLIDRKKGGELMRIASVANSLTHFLRAFTGNPIGVAGLNVANEAATSGYTLAYTRALFDNADLSGERTTYLGIVEAQSNLGASIGAFTLFFMASMIDPKHAIHYFFFIAAGIVLLVATSRFPLYRK